MRAGFDTPISSASSWIVSQRNGECQSPKIRKSLKDTDCLAAVTSGDMETAHRMVGEAAKQFGTDLETAENAVKEMQKVLSEALSAGKNAEKNTTQEDGVKSERTVSSEVRFSKSDWGINIDSTDADRYRILKDVCIVPADVDYDKVKDVDLEDYNTRKKSAVEKGLKDLAQKIGVTGVDLKNSYLDFGFSFSRKNLGISLTHQLEYGGSYQDYVKAMSCFNDLVTGAIPIETHPEKKINTSKANPDLKQVYVLVSAYKDGNSVVPVEFEVKTFWANNAGLYLSVVLTKIDSEVLETPAARNKTGDAANLLSESGYSLSSIFANVNPKDGRFLKYVPDGFLNEQQKDAKIKALQKQANEYASELNDHLHSRNGGQDRTREGSNRRTDSKGIGKESGEVRPSKKDSPESKVDRLYSRSPAAKQREAEAERRKAYAAKKPVPI